MDENRLKGSLGQPGKSVKNVAGQTLGDDNLKVKEVSDRAIGKAEGTGDLRDVARDAAKH